MKKSMLLSVLFFILIIDYTNSQDFGPKPIKPFSDFDYENDLQISARDSLQNWQEKVFLHVNDTDFKPKDVILFKANIATGPEALKYSVSNVLKVEILKENGQLLTSQYHKIVNGSASGEILIPKKVIEGRHYLRAYTRWMLNYGEHYLPTMAINIAIDKFKDVNISNEILISPEGDNFIVDVENRGIVSSSGIQDLSGKIIDETGNKITEVLSYDAGLASFTFIPKKEKSYYLKLNNGNQLALPKAVPFGLVLQVNTIKEDKISIQVLAKQVQENQEFYLIAKKQTRTYFKQSFNIADEKAMVIEVNKNVLPSGLLTLQITDNYNQIWAERSVYLEKNEVNISVNELKRSSENNNTTITYELNLEDDKSNPVTTDVSLVVNDVTQKNTVRKLNQRQQNYLTDLRLLADKTQALYKTQEVITIPDQISYSFQNGLDFYGQAYNLENELLSNKILQVAIDNGNQLKIFEAKTNENGLFTVEGIDLEGELTLTFRTPGDDTKEKLVKVIPYNFEIPELVINDQLKKVVKNKKVKSTKALVPQFKMSAFDANDKPNNLVELDEVVLVEQQKLANTSPSVYGIEPDNVVYQDPERPKTLPQLFLGVPGVYVTGLGDLNPTLSLPAKAFAGPILWVIDGFPLNQSGVGVGAISVANGNNQGVTFGQNRSGLAQVMDIVPYIDVERIEFLFGPNAAIYGTRGAGGVILIYTKNGAYSKDFIDRKDAQLTMEGFQPRISFSNNSFSQNSLKNSSTLFWNPKLLTDENGKTAFEVVIPDGVETIEIDAKVFTSNGKRGELETSVKISSK
ncbi:hypothetical protein GCM10011414_28810 [Croceivirga lutea]|uniref:TonB-dependent receptor n=1 Tax=Croceivirga lutea TaxID=1775167 RepID=UPI00163ADBF3|nr:TonB-dependent receptor plug domain-containing protein [Croceivirga lutea]GGG57207.1 hypothetical protein GCM10011414_28810 [Croceivirga lutea]